MTQVDFYILAESGERARQLYACRIAEKAYGLGHRVWIHASSAQQAAELDQLLWTFNQGSFIPHGVADALPDPDAPVVIGHGELRPGPDHHALLINLGHPVPLFFSAFERVAEVVHEDAAEKQRGRERFRFYRDRGYPLKSHNITSR